jgi:sulfhydrogenase subunit delta
MKNTPTLGIYGFTGCAGCQLAVLDCEDQLLDIFSAVDIKVFYEATSGNDDEANVDIALVEGSINTDQQAENLKKIREKAKILIAFGSCAHHGCVQAMANGDGKWEERFRRVYGNINFTVAMPMEPQPLHNLVKVEGWIPGCPPGTAQMLGALAQLINGNMPTYTESPVCLECKFNENECLINKGIMCMGPLTMGGCTAPCPTQNMPCVGCWGIIEEANHLSEMNKLKEYGYTTEEILRRFRLFGGSDMADKVSALMEAK